MLRNLLNAVIFFEKFYFFLFKLMNLIDIYCFYLKKIRFIFDFLIKNLYFKYIY